MTNQIFVRALITKGHLALVNRSANGLVLFGGKVKKKETLQGALRREIQEELGIRISVGNAVSVSEEYLKVKRKKFRVITVVFEATPYVLLTAPPAPQEDGLHPEWVDRAVVLNSARAPLNVSLAANCG